MLPAPAARPWTGARTCVLPMCLHVALLLGCFSSAVIPVHSCKAKPALMQNCLCNLVSELALWALHRLPVAGSKDVSPIHRAQCDNALWSASWSCWYREDSSLMSNTVLRHWNPNGGVWFLWLTSPTVAKSWCLYCTQEAVVGAVF